MIDTHKATIVLSRSFTAVRSRGGISARFTMFRLEGDPSISIFVGEVDDKPQAVSTSIGRDKDEAQMEAEGLASAFFSNNLKSKKGGK